MSNEPDYSIEAMIPTFAEHAKQADIGWKNNKETYQEQYPNSELPEHFNNNFNIATALSVMCREIAVLKAQVNYLKSLSRGLSPR
jgi:hypothetical protein